VASGRHRSMTGLAFNKKEATPTAASGSFQGVHTSIVLGGDIGNVSEPPETVVVVGGGVIGLSVAYNFAKRPAGPASATCTGCFHYNFPEPDLQPLLPLGKYSFDRWAEEAQDPAFVTATGYRAQSLIRHQRRQQLPA
jgi:hypothetical protein